MLVFLYNNIEKKALNPFKRHTGQFQTVKPSPRKICEVLQKVGVRNYKAKSKTPESIFKKQKSKGNSSRLRAKPSTKARPKAKQSSKSESKPNTEITVYSNIPINIKLILYKTVHFTNYLQ